MQDSYGDGWDGARYRLRDSETTNVVAVGTLDNGAEGTDRICLDSAVCYTLGVTSGTYPSEISWSFGGNLTGGAPYGPIALWLESSAISAGQACPTPAPTTETPVPTPAPTITAAPSTTPAPSPIPTTPNPTALPTPIPLFVYKVDTFEELRNAAEMIRSMINVTAPLIVMPEQVVISGDVTIFSASGDATLLANWGRHFYVTSGSWLKLEGLALLNGHTNEVDGGGSVFANTGAYLELLSCLFQNCSVEEHAVNDNYFVFGGTIALSGATANIYNCSFITSTVSTQAYKSPYGGTLSLIYDSTANIRKCRFERSTMSAAYYGWGGTISVFESSTASFEDCRFESSSAISQAYPTFGGHGGTAAVEVYSSCVFVRCVFSDSSGSDGGALYIQTSSHVTLENSIFVNNRAADEAGVLHVVGVSSCDITNCVFRANQALTGGVGIVGLDSILSVSTSAFSTNRALTGDGGVFILEGASDFNECHFSKNEAPSGKGALFYSTASVSITASSITDFSIPNANFILDHEPSQESFWLELDRVSFQRNNVSAVRSTAVAAIRNCPDLTPHNGVDFTSALLIDCTSSEVGAYCSSPDYCTNALVGIDCYCFPNGEKTDPLVDSCLSLARIYAPERDLTVVVAKPTEATATLLFVNKGGDDLAFELKQIGTTDSLWWNVTPSSGILTKDDPVATLILSLDSTQVQARAKCHTTSFSLLSNSAEDNNITISTSLFVSADPIARLSNVTLDNPHDVVAGGTLSFHLTLIDSAQLVIMEASSVVFSATLTHLASDTSVPCGVSYDTTSRQQEGECSLPDLVCNKDDADECEFSPPTGGFVLQAVDSEGAIIGAKSYAFDVTGCPKDFYENYGNCLRCPEHVACGAGSLISDWQLASGYWRASDISTKVYECRYGSRSCPGADPNETTAREDAYCASAYAGPLCSVCALEHFLTPDNECLQCDQGGAWLPTIVTATVVVSCATFVAGLCIQAGVKEKVLGWYKIGKMKGMTLIQVCQALCC